MASEPGQDRLPFEPSKKRQKQAKSKAKPAAETVKKSEKTTSAAPTKKPPYSKEEIAVPKSVSDRMVRRMAVLCGVPTVLGMATFVISYLIVSNHLFKLPNAAVVLVSMGFFGLGVLGLSYGILSASWDEEAAGSIVGWQEFKLNWGRMVGAWRSTRQKKV